MPRNTIFNILYTKYQKSLAIFFAAVLLAGFLPQVALAKGCTSLVEVMCIEITSLNPDPPVFGRSFTVNAQISFSKDLSGQPPLNFIAYWSINGSSAAVIQPVVVNSNKAGTTQDISQNFVGDASAGFIAAGTNTIKLEIQGSGSINALRAVDQKTFSFAPAQPSDQPRVEITYKRASFINLDSLEYTFSALYYPANSTAPLQDSTKAVVWNFGDGPDLNNGYVANHTFSQAGSYTVTVKIMDGGNVVAQTSIQLSVASGNPNEKISFFEGLFGTLLSIVNIILGMILAIARWVVWTLGNYVFVPLLEMALTIRAADMVDVVTVGWAVIRDVVNMLFILVLIIIGFGTMLRIESYNYKKLLVNLILMALLVNFSLVIGRIIIQFADIIQFSFLSKDTGINGVRDLFKNLSSAHVSNIIDGLRASSFNVDKAAAGTFSIIFQFILELAVILTFAALAVFVLIRVVALWILLILSPFAYALAILPATSGLAKRWWQNFMKYVFFTPIIAFFLMLTLSFYRGALKIFPSGSIFDPGSRIDFVDYMNQVAARGQVSFADAVRLALVYIVILVFLWAGMIITRQMGIFGADAIVGLAERGLKAPLALGGKGIGAITGMVGRTYTGWVGRKIGEVSKKGEEAAKLARKMELRAKAAKTPEEKTKYEAEAKAARARQRSASMQSAGWRALSLLNPKVVAEAWKKRREEKELRAYVPAIGHMQDTFNRIIPTEWVRPGRLARGEIGKKTYHGLVGERAVVAKEAEDLLKGVRTREDAARTLRDAFKSGDKDEIMAGLKVLQHGNWQDDYMNLEGLTFSPIRYLNHITEKMKQAGFSDEEMQSILDDLKETGEQTGRIRAYGYTTEDEDGGLRRANDLGFYERLKGEDLGKQFTTLGEKFKLAFDETGSDEFKKIAEEFERAAGRARAGESFDKIIDTKYGTERDDQNLRDALTARRFMNEAHIKFQRGNAGQHARNIEAAIIVDQTPEGWTDQNVLGKMIMHELGPNIIQSITARIHESQGRLLYGFGGFRDKQTGKWSLPDQSVIVESKAALTLETDPEKRKVLEERVQAHELGWKKVIETRKLSPKFFGAITQSPRLFTFDQRKAFVKQFNEYIKDPKNGLTQYAKEWELKEPSQERAE